MEKQRTTKIIALVALVIAILGVSVAFAAMSTPLTINGTAEMQTATWKVKFQNLSEMPTLTGAASVTTAPILSDTNIGTFDVVLTKPGDSVTYTFDVTNTGTLDAVIGTFTKNTTPTCTGLATESTVADADAELVCGNLTYTLTYTASGDPVSEGDTLTKATGINHTRNMTLKLTYDGNTLPTDDVKIGGLGITIVYVQS